MSTEKRPPRIITNCTYIKSESNTNIVMKNV